MKIDRFWIAASRTTQTIYKLITEQYLATYGVAVSRILLGVTGAGILLTNFSAKHYLYTTGSAWNGEIENPVSPLVKLPIFSLFHMASLAPRLFTILYILLLALSVLIVLGWRTRVLMPIFLVLWVSLIELNEASGDQGDNAYRIFVLSMCFVNSSMRWSLDARRKRIKGKSDNFHWLPISVHNLVLFTLAFQICAIYLSGGLYKAGGSSWSGGYAIYNPLNTTQFGTWPILSEILTTWGPLVALATWGSLLFQIAFPFLLFNKYTRRVALFGILAFHLGIALLMGLPWFSLTMISMDAIFISDKSFVKTSKFVSPIVDRVRIGLPLWLRTKDSREVTLRSE